MNGRKEGKKQDDRKGKSRMEKSKRKKEETMREKEPFSRCKRKAGKKERIEGQGRRGDSQDCQKLMTSPSDEECTWFPNSFPLR